MNRVRVKFCGLMRAQDIEMAATLGADALGFVCAPQSKRYVALDHLPSLLQAVPPFVERVALFQNASAEHIRAVLAQASFSLLQFHGAESAAFCNSFGLPYLKAIPMSDAPDLFAYAREFESAKALLLDSHSLKPGGAIGGTGRGFDHLAIPNNLPHRLVLAGGLRPEAVASVIEHIRPWAVDVSSGIESAPGVKDAGKMQDFLAAVRHAHR